MNIKKYFKNKKRVWIACIVLSITVLVVFAVSEVYAKYISSHNSNNTPNLAQVGITEFELVNYQGKTSDILKYDYTKIVPGADIPGPHINLKINSEVSYTLFLRVKVLNGNLNGDDKKENEENLTAKTAHIETKIDTTKWELYSTTTETVKVKPEKDTEGDTEGNTEKGIEEDTEGDAEEDTEKENKKEYTVYTYKYIVDSPEGINDYVFKPGQVYNCVGDNAIRILKDDVIYVSQYYTQKNGQFELTFEAYIRQVL